MGEDGGEGEGAYERVIQKRSEAPNHGREERERNNKVPSIDKKC